RLREMRRLARLKAQAASGGGVPLGEGPPLEPPTEIQGALLFFLLGAAVLALLSFVYYLVNPVFDRVPSGRTPRLDDYLKENLPGSRDPRDKPPGNYGGRPPPAGGRRGPADLKRLRLLPVTSPGELWEAYTFATGQIVEEVPSMAFERNYLNRMVLQAASFPKVYRDWETYEGCAVEEVSLGPDATSLGPVEPLGGPPGRGGRPRDPGSEAASDADREVVLACGEMVEEYGLSLAAREPATGTSVGSLAGCATMRVKRLPEDCHIAYDEEGAEPAVVCTVDWRLVLEAQGLEGVAYIESIAVARQWRGSGLAEMLLDFLEKKGRAWGLRLVGLHVHRDNWAALKFYRRQGFEATSDWLGWGELYFLLVKPL
ncbi:unnamed protein product, partial [Prorocentrum cordatum]